jgi:hypothetical protein
MALKITKAHEPIIVKQLVTTIYGPPGVGKTSLAFTVEDNLVLDFDKGAYRAIGRKDTVQVQSWNDVAGMTAQDVEGYKCLTIDTGGRMLDMMTHAMGEDNSKMVRAGGQPTMQGWGKLKSDFANFIKRIREFGLDIIIITHSSEDKSGDDIVDRIDVQGSSKNEIYKVSDMMGRLSIKNGKRVLNFSPTDISFGKNPAQFGEIIVPDVSEEICFLGGYIESAKTFLNKMSSESVEVQAIVDEWIVKFNDCLSAEEFNDLMDSVKKVDDRCALNVKRIMVKMAKEKKIGFDQGKAVFTDENA